MMRRRICTHFIACLCITSWFFTAAQPFSPLDQTEAPQQEDQVSRLGTRKSLHSLEELGHHKEQFEQTDRSEMSRLGSRPPNCDHGCGECKPCVAVQVPTNDMQLQSPNYGPEEWSCRCGSSFFTP
nr:PREDICTED: EPIDERMAL PATTERNING FACTOR-like protein 3 [Daucus carota subsp. sativus]